MELKMTTKIATAVKKDLKFIAEKKHHSNIDQAERIITFGENLLSYLENNNKYTAEMLDCDVESYMSGNSWDYIHENLLGYSPKRGYGFVGLFPHLCDEVL